MTNGRRLRRRARNEIRSDFEPAFAQVLFLYINKKFLYIFLDKWHVGKIFGKKIYHTWEKNLPYFCWEIHLPYLGNFGKNYFFEFQIKMQKGGENLIQKRFPADTDLKKEITFLKDPKIDAELYSYFQSMSYPDEGVTIVVKTDVPS